MSNAIKPPQATMVQTKSLEAFGDDDAAGIDEVRSGRLLKSCALRAAGGSKPSRRDRIPPLIPRSPAMVDGTSGNENCHCTNQRESSTYT